MGTPMAPNFANLFMSCFEDKFIFNTGTRLMYYRRYIDDLFFLWNGTGVELVNFVEHLNKLSSHNQIHL